MCRKLNCLVVPCADDRRLVLREEARQTRSGVVGRLIQTNLLAGISRWPLCVCVWARKIACWALNGGKGCLFRSTSLLNGFPWDSPVNPNICPRVIVFIYYLLRRRFRNKFQARNPAEQQVLETEVATYLLWKGITLYWVMKRCGSGKKEWDMNGFGTLLSHQAVQNPIKAIKIVAQHWYLKA